MMPSLRSLSFKVIATALACSQMQVSVAASSADAPIQATLVVHPDRPLGTIDPDIYGQFAEHLGRGIYEGVFVGENSPIPNTQGFRKDVVAALKDLGVPLVRWPGGCFADEYHWRDGIGPRDQRPKRVNTNWGGVSESNAFGTHEFMAFAELIGAEVYINGNIGTGTPREMAEWVEYLTGDTDSELAELRRRNGRKEPWRVKYFAAGNETWGCGGGMQPEYYANLYRHYATFIKAPPKQRPLRIASGANGGNTQWTEVLMRDAVKHMDALSVHYYTLPTGKWDKKGSATDFNEAEWHVTLANTLRMDAILTNHGNIMDKYDPAKRVGLLVDEWGTWYDVEPGTEPGFLYQQNTLRDALVAAANFDIFHKHAARVRMTNIAQMVNVLQAMILTDGARMTLTPTYHAFHLYKPFRGAQSLASELATPDYVVGKASIPALSASVARNDKGELIVALTNFDPHRPARVQVQLGKTTVKRAQGRVLTADRMQALNTFDQPRTVTPTAVNARDVVLPKGDEPMSVALPAKSITVLVLQ